MPDPSLPGVLITRPAAGAAATARLVAAQGFAPVVAPVLCIAPRPFALPATLPQAVLVTSGNALASLPAGLHGTMLLAVGDATAARARTAGFTQVHSAGRDAAALAALATRHCTPADGPLLLACGEGQGHALVAALRGQGFRVSRRVAYAAHAVDALPEAGRAALHDGRIAAALFFSPASAQAFVRLLPPLPPDIVAGVQALAISSAAASALSPLPWRRIRVASRPNQDELLALL